MKRILRLTALAGGVVAAVALVSIVPIAQSSASAQVGISIGRGGVYGGLGGYNSYGAGYGSGYYGSGAYGSGRGEGYGGYGNRYGGYSGYGNGPYGYSTNGGYNNGYYSRGYGNGGYYGPAYGRTYTGYGYGW